MPYIGKKPENIIATAVDSTTGDFSGNVTAGGTLAVTGETTLATHLNMGDGDIIKLGASADLTIQHDGSNSIIKDGGTGNLQIQADDFKIMNAAGDENILFGAEDGTVRLFHNNVTKFETTSSGVTVVGDIANYSGDLTLDVAGDIILDADGGAWRFKDAGTSILQIARDSSTSVNFFSAVSDMDILFKGNDGGSTITALRLDMSDAGSAHFNGTVQTSTINTGTSTGTLTLFGGATNKGGTIEMSGGNNTGSTGSGIVFKTGASTSSPSEKMRIDQTGAVTKPNQPAFLANGLASELTDLAINTDHTIVFSGERFDQNDDYNTSNGEFTAPVTGKYQFNFMLYTQNVDTGANYYQVKLKTSNHTYIYIIEPKFSSDVLYFTWHAPNLLVDMDASDTAKVQILQNGGTAQLHVSNNNNYTVFSGHLVC